MLEKKIFFLIYTDKRFVLNYAMRTKIKKNVKKIINRSIIVVKSRKIMFKFNGGKCQSIRITFLLLSNNKKQNLLSK